MRKLTGFWLGYLCLVLLAACVRKDEPLAPENDPKAEDVGHAELRLPALPAGFLAKRSLDTVDTVDTTRAYFVLTITGPGMAPRRQSWPLGSSATTVRVEKIPVGYRLFTGELEMGGLVHYSDSAWVNIEKGKTAYVHLKLGSSTGDAEICVEIEGLPLPANCRPPTPRVPDVSGCWYFLVSDSLFRDTVMLSIVQRDSILQARLLKPAGTWDTALGSVNRAGYVLLGLDSTDTFYLSAQLDTMGQVMRGKFFTKISPRIYTATLLARRFSCRIDTVPVDTLPIPSDSLTCWDAAQTMGGTGRLLMLERNAQIYGLFQWAGYPNMPVWGYKARIPVPVTSSGVASLGVYLNGVLPPGMARFSGRPDSVQYKGQLVPDGRPTSIVNGTVNGIVLPTGAFGQLGEWKAYRDTCSQAERRTLLNGLRL